VHYEAMQPSLPEGVTNTCSEMECEHLCLLGPSDSNDTTALTARCACSDVRSALALVKHARMQGFELSANGTHCTEACSSKQLLCGGQDPRCISRVYWCDGQSQCWDHEDERDCRAFARRSTVNRVLL